MSNQRADAIDRPIGELWVELSRDEKKKICDALIDRNQSDVLQHFDNLVRFTRGYLQQQPTGSLPSSNETCSVSISSDAGSPLSDVAPVKRENDEVPLDMSNTPRKKARKAPTPIKRKRAVAVKTLESDRVKEEDENDES